jgi:hypothetical protein
MVNLYHACSRPRSSTTFDALIPLRTRIGGRLQLRSEVRAIGAAPADPSATVLIIRELRELSLRTAALRKRGDVVTVSRTLPRASYLLSSATAPLQC